MDLERDNCPTGLHGLIIRKEHYIVNLAENYFGFNYSVVFAENHIEAVPPAAPGVPISLHLSS